MRTRSPNPLASSGVAKAAPATDATCSRSEGGDSREGERAECSSGYKETAPGSGEECQGKGSTEEVFKELGKVLGTNPDLARAAARKWAEEWGLGSPRTRLGLTWARRAMLGVRCDAGGEV